MEYVWICPQDGEQVVFDLFGREKCVCKEGSGRVGGSCRKLYKKEGCQDGEVVMDKSLAAKVSGNSTACGDDSSCKDPSQCRSYQRVLRSLSNEDGQKLFTDFMSKFYECPLDQISSAWSNEKKRNGVCCPNDETRSIITPRSVVEKLEKEEETFCGPNFCREDQEIHNDGVEFGCKEKTPSFDPVPRMLTSNPNRCRRNTIWSETRRRCVRIFVG